jgi:hypothetical protein
MRPIPAHRFERAVRRLDAEALAAFVADVWTARGATVHHDGTRVVVERPSGRLSIAVHDGTGPFGVGRLSSPPAPADANTDAEIDRVVSTVDSDAPGVVGPDDLYQTVLYGLPSTTADDCCRRHLGLPARHDPDPTLPTTRVTVVLVGLLVLAVVVGTASVGDYSPRPLVGDPQRAGVEPTDVTPPTGPTPSSLGAAHAAALRGTAFVFRTERTVRAAAADDIRSRTVTVGCVSADRRIVTGAITVVGPEAVLFAERLRNGTTVAFYADNESLVRATATGRATTVERILPDAYDPTERFFLLPDPREPGEVLRGVRLRATERDGIRRIDGTLFENATVFGRAHGVTAPRNLSARAAVDDGVVRRYQLSYDATFVDRRIAVERSGRTRRVKTAPDRPAWATKRGQIDANAETVRRSVAAACTPEE